ncbi:uncharacterized protein LOC132738044 [Ruditapes philippinarum]|uniref:uncharacterized protein LOC132738044 n=1 Tax=Ruditapes philippinarum TaxID=129788 RepID=UPI00295AEFF5|nr:uncharacterized protein LOC132738044 [Ruditapes philippinarum]
MNILFGFVLVANCIDVTFGACYAKLEDGVHCTPKDGITMLAGSELLMPDVCEKCTCSRHSDSSSLFLSCCGYGKYAGVIAPPPGCKVITGDDGCSIKMVQAIDHSQPCV